MVRLGSFLLLPLVPQNTAVFGKATVHSFKMAHFSLLTAQFENRYHQKKESATALASNCVIRHDSIKQKAVLDVSDIFGTLHLE